VRDERAEQCPDGVAVQRSVGSRVGHDPFRADAATSIDAVIRRVEGTFVARFFVRGPNGEALGNREFTSANERCDAIAEAVALALAIVIDPTVALRPDPQPAALSANPPPVDGTPPARARVAALCRSAPRHQRPRHRRRRSVHRTERALPRP
jgi:hypothetical protein